MIFDAIIIAGIAIFGIIGYFKGFLSQFSSLAGIVLAYFLSPKWAALLSGLFRDLLPFSYVISDLFARLVIGILIFLAVKLVGKFLEYIFLAKFREMGGINKWGGFFFGILKAVLVVFVIMIFVTLIPSKVTAKRFKGLDASLVYKVSKRFNPVINPDVMENLRRLGQLSWDEKKLSLINQSAVYKDYLKTREIENPLSDDSAIENFRKGDVSGLQKSGFYKLLKDKDFMDFIYGEKYYNVEPKEGKQ